MRQMGFFDNLKSSLAETGQDLSQKAKDTTEIFRLTNLNKTKEKEQLSLRIAVLFCFFCY